MENAVVSAIKFSLTPVNENPQKIVISYMDLINAEIPQNAVISASEGFFPALYPGRTVMNFPIGLGIAEYLVLPNKNSVAEPPIFYTAETFLGAKTKEAIDICLTKRIAKDGYDIENAKRIGYFSILKKRQ